MERKYKIFLIVILVLHLIFVLFCVNQPLIGDEIVFLESAKGVLKTGRPIFDYSVFKPNFQGLWHPPLYIHLLSLFMLLFGDSIYSLRAVSIIFNFLTIILVFFITREILRDRENGELWALFAVAIYALNPLTIQNSVIIDIDGGILNFAIYLFLYFLIKNKSFYYLVPSLVLVFLAKESGPFVIFGSLFLFYLVTLNFKKLIKTVLLFFSSGVVFVSLFWIYCNLLSLDFTMMFKHNFGKGFQSLNLDTLARSLWSLKVFIYFAVPFFVLLFFFLFFCFIFLNYKSLKFMGAGKKKILLLGIFATITIGFFGYFGATSWGFPKYYITALPAMSVFIASLFSYSKIKIRRYGRFFILMILLGVYFSFFVSNPLFAEFDSNVHNADFLNAGKLVAKSFVLYAIIPFIISFFVLWINSREEVVSKILQALVFLTFFVYFYLNIINASADYSTYNRYGDKGILEVVRYFEENDIFAGKIATYPHLGSYLEMAEYYDITWDYYSVDDFKKNIVDNEKIEYVVVWTRDIERIGENMDYFVLEKEIGSYFVFRKVLL